MFVTVAVEVIPVVDRMLMLQIKPPLIRWCWHWMVRKTSVSAVYVVICYLHFCTHYVTDP